MTKTHHLVPEVTLLAPVLRVAGLLPAELPRDPLALCLRLRLHDLHLFGEFSRSDSAQYGNQSLTFHLSLFSVKIKKYEIWKVTEHLLHLLDLAAHRRDAHALGGTLHEVLHVLQAVVDLVADIL